MIIKKKTAVKSDEQKKTTEGMMNRLKDGQRHGVHRAVSFGINATMGRLARTPLTEDDFIECEALHPRRKRPVPRMPPNENARVFIDLPELQRVIKKRVANGSQPGPSGMTGEMLNVFVQDDQCKYGIQSIVQAIADGWFGDDPIARALILMSRLVLLPK